jgi:hypothetical protein
MPRLRTRIQKQGETMSLDKEDVIQKREELMEERDLTESKLRDLEIRIRKLKQLEEKTKFSFEKEANHE